MRSSTVCFFRVAGLTLGIGARLLASDDNTIVSHLDLGHGVQDPDYLTYLRAWQRGDYSAALAQLSKYFDHSSSHQGQASHQYALLNLALLQADFGCYKEALWAIYETIDAARDHEDDVCLNFALSWLADVAASQPQLLKHDSMMIGEESRDYIIRNAKANDLPELESLAHLTKHRNLSGREAYDLLARSEKITLDSNHDITATQFQAKANWWRQLDVEELYHLYLSLGLSFCDMNAVHEDVARLRCTIADALTELGEVDQAERMLSDVTKDCMKHHNFHKLITIQQSVQRIAKGQYSARDELHETMKLEDSPLHVEARVMRYLKMGRGPEALTDLNKYLRPQSPHSPNALYHAVYLRLLTEIYLDSAEPQRAFSAIARALKCGHEHSLYREIRLCRALYPRIRKALEGG